MLNAVTGSFPGVVGPPSLLPAAAAVVEARTTGTLRPPATASTSPSSPDFAAARQRDASAADATPSVSGPPIDAGHNNPRPHHLLGGSSSSSSMRGGSTPHHHHHHPDTHSTHSGLRAARPAPPPVPPINLNVTPFEPLEAPATMTRTRSPPRARQRATQESLLSDDTGNGARGPAPAPATTMTTTTTTKGRLDVLSQQALAANAPSFLAGAPRAILPQPAAPEERPTYVNPKQYHRILKRRAARAKLETLWKTHTERKQYLHESRHKHACRRKRGPGGRFLTKAELEELARQDQSDGSAGLNGGGAPVSDDDRSRASSSRPVAGSASDDLAPMPHDLLGGA